jgi:hypothetical protein
MLAKVFGRTLSDFGPEFGSSGRVPVPALACALARIEVEIPAHLMDLISQYNTERAANHLQGRMRAASEARQRVSGPENGTMS